MEPASRQKQHVARLQQDLDSRSQPGEAWEAALQLDRRQVERHAAEAGRRRLSCCCCCWCAQLLLAAPCEVRGLPSVW
jgi:hypothetical protein